MIVGCIKEEDSLGELRVTLIATGFDKAAEIQVEDNISQSQENLSSSNGTMATSNVPSPSIAKYNASVTSNVITEKDKAENIDIPAFLRQQAD